ncbi:MAG: DUF1207 domain-containing protein [Ignavibacteriae bacterium]|nr:MAG: DUF1207 domain-containing protein [Ignavibacteriota bacterium]
MKRRFLTLSVCIFLTLNTFPQTADEWFPAELNIQPLTANYLEAKAGFEYLFDINKVQINIGVTRDIYHYHDDKTTISFGADLFTYTRTRAQSNFKFPVETIDYMFGINAGYKKEDGNKEIGLRLRFSHISAHLVDGLYDAESERWLNVREPFVYSKEFIEFFPYIRKDGVRIYLGLTYIIHVIPDLIKKGIFQAGFDYYILPLRNSSFIPFIAYDFKLTGIEKYSGNNIVTAGIKFGEPLSRGFSILISYLSGKSVHGEFYDISENYWTIGLNLDL